MINGLHFHDLFTLGLYLLTLFSHFIHRLPSYLLQPPICSENLSFLFLKIPHIIEIIWCSSFWLISLSIAPSRSIHVVTNGKISCFYGWRIFHSYTYHIFLIHLSIYGHLCIHIMAIVNNAAEEHGGADFKYFHFLQITIQNWNWWIIW